MSFQKPKRNRKRQDQNLISWTWEGTPRRETLKEEQKQKHWKLCLTDEALLKHFASLLCFPQGFAFGVWWVECLVYKSTCTGAKRRCWRASTPSAVTVCNHKSAIALAVASFNLWEGSENRIWKLQSLCLRARFEIKTSDLSEVTLSPNTMANRAPQDGWKRWSLLWILHGCEG